MIIIRCWMIFIYSLTLPDPSQIIVFVGLCVASWDTVKCPNYGRTIYYQDSQHSCTYPASSLLFKISSNG